MSTTEQIVANAKFAKNAVVELEPKLAYGKRIWEYFHLHPSAEGILLVVNHPRYPMYRTELTRENLKDRILEVEEKLLPLLSAEEPGPELGTMMAEFGFRRSELDREEVGHSRQREAHVRASFIKDMIHGGAEFRRIQFLGSDVTPDEEEPSVCFDVAGYRDGTVFVFQLLNGRSTDPYDRISRCRAYIDAHRDAVEKLLAAYPRTACMDNVMVHHFRYVAVMKYAADSDTDWQKLTTAAGASTWFYEPAFSFRIVKA